MIFAVTAGWAAGLVLTLLAVLGILPAWIGAAAGLVLAQGGLIAAVVVRQERRRLNDPARWATPGAPPLRMFAEADRTIADAMRQAGQRIGGLETELAAERALLDRLPDPLVIVSQAGAVLRLNAAARTVFGDDLPAVLRRPDVRSALTRAIEQGTDQTADVALAVPIPRDVRTTVLPIAQPTDDGRAAVIVLSDRTRDLAVERMRADFVANVSHELRTPLAALIGFTETLRDAAADDDVARAHFLGIMAEQGARMSRLIDDLLNLSRIELVEHQVPTEPTDLSDLTRRFVAGYRALPPSDRSTLTTEIAPNLPAVLGDSDQIEQILQNLVDNAMKYGRNGGATRLIVRDATGDALWPTRPGVVLTVADDGLGIPKEHLPRLTERFYRVDKARSRSAGGTGLGLAIVKHIVNRHRGQLRIESDVGHGTTVSIWLPAARPNPTSR